MKLNLNRSLHHLHPISLHLKKIRIENLFTNEGLIAPNIPEGDIFSNTRVTASRELRFAQCDKTARVCHDHRLADHRLLLDRGHVHGVVVSVGVDDELAVACDEPHFINQVRRRAAEEGRLGQRQLFAGDGAEIVLTVSSREERILVVQGLASVAVIIALVLVNIRNLSTLCIKQFHLHFMLPSTLGRTVFICSLFAM